jgi:heavy metal efflux system protein
MNKVLKGIIAFSLKNSYFILFSTALLLIAGIITFRNMPIEAFPDVTNTEISIITQWPGRSAGPAEDQPQVFNHIWPFLCKTHF